MNYFLLLFFPMERYGYDDAANAADYVQRKIDANDLCGHVTDGLILGTGLGQFDEEYRTEERIEISFHEIFMHLGITESVDEVEGHKKKLIIDRFDESDELLIMQSGREHIYQGVHPKRATFWIRVMQLLGVKTLGSSSAVGVITPETIKVPQIVLVNSENDDIGDSPLLGSDEPWGPRFQDLNDMYPESTRQTVRTVAAIQQIDLPEGMYIRTPTSPSFERPEDVYRMRHLVRGIWEEAKKQKGEKVIRGKPAAVVGMTIPPESIVVHHARRSEKHPAFRDGYFVLAAATDYAGALGPDGYVDPPTHAEVQDRARVLQEEFGFLVQGTLNGLRVSRKANGVLQ